MSLGDAVANGAFLWGNTRPPGPSGEESELFMVAVIVIAIASLPAAFTVLTARMDRAPRARATSPPCYRCFHHVAEHAQQATADGLYPCQHGRCACQGFLGNRYAVRQA